MLESLIVGLVLAAVSALGLLAYYHPHAYRKIAIPLILIAIVAFTGIAVWGVVNELTYNALIPFIDPARQGDAKRAAEALKLPALPTIIAFAVILIYLFFLLMLPNILEKKDDDKP